MINPYTMSNTDIQNHIAALEREISGYKKLLAWRGNDPVQKYGWVQNGEYFVYDNINLAVEAAETRFGIGGHYYLQKIWVPFNA